MMDEFVHWPKLYLLLSTTCHEMLSWMMDEFIRWLKPYLLVSATCHEMLSWMMDVFIHWPNPTFSCQQLVMKYCHG